MIGCRVITVAVAMSLSLSAAAAEPPSTQVPAEPDVEAPAAPAPEGSTPAEPPSTDPSAPDAPDASTDVPPAPTEPVVEPGVESAIEPGVEPVTEPGVEPATEPGVEPGTEPVAEPEPEPPPPPEPEPDGEPGSIDPFGDDADDEPWPDEDEEDEPLPVYDPLRDSPQAIRARHWVRGGIVLISAGSGLLVGAVLMGASDPCNLAIGNSCQAEARNRAALVMGVPAALLIGGGVVALVTGINQRNALAVDLQASRDRVGLSVRGRF